MVEQGHRITEQNLKQALGNKYSVHANDLKITTFSVSDGTKLGDNYACILKHVLVESDIRGISLSDSLMVKCLPMHKGRAGFLKEVKGPIYFFTSTKTIFIL